MSKASPAASSRVSARPGGNGAGPRRRRARCGRRTRGAPGTGGSSGGVREAAGEDVPFQVVHARPGGAGGRRRRPSPPTARRGASRRARGRGSRRSHRGPASRTPASSSALVRRPGGRPRDAGARRARARRRRSGRGSGPGTRRRSTAAFRRPARPRPSRHRNSRCRGRACAGSSAARRTGRGSRPAGSPAGFVVALAGLRGRLRLVEDPGRLQNLDRALELDVPLHLLGVGQGGAPAWWRRRPLADRSRCPA